MEAPLSYSLAYAAPETIAAAERKERVVVADPAVDVWALGVMAYELFTRTRVMNPHNPEQVRELLRIMLQLSLQKQ